MGGAPHAAARMPRRRDLRGRRRRRGRGARATRLDAVFAAHGARSRGEDPARSWERGRFASPALRDTLLDVGVLAETLETATTWAELPALKRAVTDALTGEPHRRRHEADRAVPHLARLSRGRLAVLHRRRRAHRRPARAVGTGEGCRVPRHRRRRRHDHPPPRRRPRPPPLPRGRDRRARRRYPASCEGHPRSARHHEPRRARAAARVTASPATGA